jgi:hypothetical protein
MPVLIINYYGEVDLKKERVLNLIGDIIHFDCNCTFKLYGTRRYN